MVDQWLAPGTASSGPERLINSELPVNAPLAQNFPQGAVIAFDHDLRYLAAAGLGRADAGLSRAILEGRTIFEVFSPDVASEIEQSR